MDFDDVNSIADEEFSGFVKIAALQKSNCLEIPHERGVYLVLRTSNLPPQWLLKSVGGHFKGEDPTISIERLHREWVKDAKVLYIGKAGSIEGSATLRSRIRAYMKFGMGQPVGHKGGRLIWQLTDHADLLVCWKPTPANDPRIIERELIQQFKNSHRSRRPFANLQD